MNPPAMGPLVCPTGKVRHRTKDGALLAVRNMRKIHGNAYRRNAVPSRAYQCQLCQGWHTSKKRRKPGGGL